MTTGNGYIYFNKMYVYHLILNKIKFNIDCTCQFLIFCHDNDAVELVAESSSMARHVLGRLGSDAGKFLRKFVPYFCHNVSLE